MRGENQVPYLLKFMFGESADVALKTASEQLLQWSKAMDAWLEERQRNNAASTLRTSRVAWERLLSKCIKAPWEIGEEELQRHIEQMEAEGYSTNTINFEMTCLSSFYRWCSKHKVDPVCEEEFNPAARVKRPKANPYAGVHILSIGEVRRLLGLMKRDESLLGRRDYALFLARFNLGVRLSELQQLMWGQIELDEEVARVRWRPGKNQTTLPAAVWEAICSYLELSGRLEGMKAEDYIFAPLRDPLNRAPDGQAMDWCSERYISSHRIKRNLKIYGLRAGIPDEKLRLPTLRHTAVLLRLEAGDSLEELHQILESESRLGKTREYLMMLPELPKQSEVEEEGDAEEIELPERTRYIRKPGEGILHGLYAQCQPEEEVQEMLREDIHGLDVEIAGLRILARKLVERQKQVEEGDELALLGSAYGQAADRLREMIKGEQQLEEAGEQAYTEAVLGMLDNAAAELGGKPISQEVRKLATGSEVELNARTRQLTEEIATTRLVLRRCFSLALEAETVRDQIHYTDIYGSNCMRLLRMMKFEQAAMGKLGGYLRTEMEAALFEVNAEFGLDLGS
jgi:integrase